MVGAFTLGMAIALPVLMFSCLNLRTLYVTDCASRYRFRDYLAVRLTTAAGSVVFIMLLSMAAGYKGPMIVTIGFISCAKAVEYISDMLYGLFHRQEQMAAISISMILRGTLSVCALGLALHFTGSLPWASFGLLASALATLLGFDLPVILARSRIGLGAAVRDGFSYAYAVFSRNSANFQQIRSIVILGAPLGLVVMLVSLNINIPRYFVERAMGLREQGIFSSIANLIAAGTVLMAALGQCATPRLARHFAAGEMRAFRSLVWLLVAVSVGGGLAGLLLALGGGRQVLTLIYTAEYAARQDVFIWLMAGSGVLYLGNTMGVALTAARCLTPQLPLFAAAAASTAVACAFLVPVMGLSGAAAALCISALIQSSGGAILLWSTCRRAELKGTETVPVEYAEA
jgi:O-antigen/teichoic acid export membrane protein